MNIRMPGFISNEFLQIQDEYLEEVREEKGNVTVHDMEEVKSDSHFYTSNESLFPNYIQLSFAIIYYIKKAFEKVL